jgi:hypothetical protein
MKTILSALAACLVIPSAFGAISYNQTITYINGSGNLNTGWTANDDGGIELGLRADNRDNGTVPISAPGVYSFAPGNSTVAPTHADWNYQFTINSDPANGTAPLSTYDFYLVVVGPGIAGGVPITINAVTGLPDDTFGNNTSSQGHNVTVANGTTQLNTTLETLNNVAANSQTISFAPFGDHSNLGGVYDFELYATAAGAGAGGAKVDDVSIEVQVGAVPEPTTVVAGAMLFLPFGASAIRILRKKRTA